MNHRALLRTVSLAFIATVLTAFAAAHPGHEPDDFVHEIAHELASPRGILAIIVLIVAASLWAYGRKNRK